MADSATKQFCYGRLPAAFSLRSVQSGIAMAAGQTDVKRALAYSSIENIGINIKILQKNFGDCSMYSGFRIGHLHIEVMQQPGQPPGLFIAPELPGDSTHHGF